METWQIVLRKGIFPQLSTPGLEALRDALLNDDPRLVQKMTARPVRPSQPVEAACLIGYCGWMEMQTRQQEVTVGEVQQFFARACFEADELLGEPAAVRWFLNPYDNWPREEMIKNLLPEIEDELVRRKDQSQEPDYVTTSR